MNVPDDRRYTADHEWALAEGARVRVGISDYAQDALGDVVFVSLPAIGLAVEAGGALSEVESTKSVSDVYSPVTGRVVEVNSALADSPNRINDDPYGQGWICVIEVAGEPTVQELLDPDSYRRLISE